jgi:hypothetical protein
VKKPVIRKLPMYGGCWFVFLPNTLAPCRSWIEAIDVVCKWWKGQSDAPLVDRVRVDIQQPDVTAGPLRLIAKKRRI